MEYRINYFQYYIALIKKKINMRCIPNNLSDDECEILYLLFDSQYYLSQLSIKERRKLKLPLEHFLKNNWNNYNPHPLFDTNYYKQKNKGVLTSGKNALIHFITEGYLKGFKFHPLFDNEYYKSNDPDYLNNKNLLVHYLLEGHVKGWSPTSLFDHDFYSSQIEKNISKDIPLLVHYLRYGYKNGLNPHPAFDTNYYIANNLEIIEKDQVPLLHFCNSKIPPNSYYSERYFFSQNDQESFFDGSFYFNYFKKFINKKERIIFVGHEASRTGAPLILLNLLKRFSIYTDIESILILNDGGPLLDEYKEVAHVMVMEHPARGENFALGELSFNAEEEIITLLKIFSNNPPKLAIVNSVNSFPIGHTLAKHGLKLISLIHDMPHEFSEKCKQRLFQYSSKVIYPSAAVKNAWEKNIEINKNQTYVLPQGLLDNNLDGVITEVARQEVRKELGLSKDTFIIIGCGATSLRKGIDYFIHVARELKKTTSFDFCFIWVGEIIQDQESIRVIHYLNYEKSLDKNLENVFFIGERENIEKYLHAADVFILPSRADPFPCILLEAMACKLPSVAFYGAGGAEEVLQENCGVLCPYGDISAMTSAIAGLLESPDLRNETGNNAKLRISKSYIFDNYFKKLTELIPIKYDDRSITKNNNQNVQSNKRIYFSSCDWSISGVNTFTTSLIQGLNKRGYEAVLLFDRGRFSLFENNAQEYIPDIPIKFLQPINNSSEALWESLKNFLENHSPCIYIPNYDFVGSAISPVLNNNIGILGITHSDDPMHYEHTYRLGHYWNTIITVSDFIKRRVIEMNQSFEDKIRYIPFGVPVGNVPEKFVKKCINNMPLRLVYAGRFESSQKCIFDYVKLAWELTNKNIEFNMVMVGEGTDFDRVKSELGPLIEKGVITLPGRLDNNEIIKLYDQSDLFLLFSEFEGLSLSLLESMERGCIPIVYDIASGIPELISNEVNGYVLSGKKIEKVVKIIEYLSNNRNLLGVMGKNARKTVIENYNLEYMIDQYVNVINETFMDIESGKPRIKVPFKSTILPSPIL